MLHRHADTLLQPPPHFACAPQVFDARNMLRPLSTVMPYAPAELLAWNPLDTTSVMIGSSSGMFAFMDINNPGTAEPYQVTEKVQCVTVVGGQQVVVLQQTLGC